MQKEIIINASDDLQRIAIVEDGKLAELFVESEEKERMVGDIYLGTVAKVMPGIQASFLDIGLGQDAFLHFSDVGDAFREYAALTGDDDEIEELKDDGAEENEEKEKDQKRGRRRRRPPSQVQLTKGQEVVVQIFKEPVGNKGVRVTTEVALPGRFLVLMPFDNKIGVSRKIQNFKEKRRLRRLVRSILPSGFGVIIRTVAEGKAEDILREVDIAPDVIIADYQLDDGALGTDVIDALRGQHGPVPACLVTANRSPDLQGICEKLGAVLIQKPIDPGELRSFIEGALAN